MHFAEPARLVRAEFIEFYRAELQRTGVDARLGTEVTEADMDAYGAVFLATGTESADSPQGAIDAVQMLADRRAPEAQELTVHGDTETAMFAALWLAEQGRKVTLSSASADVGLDTNDMQRNHLTVRNVAIVTDQAAPAGGTVVWAQDRRASDVLATAVDGERVRAIGTRFRGGRMYEATQSGFWAAAEV